VKALLSALLGGSFFTQAEATPPYAYWIANEAQLQKTDLSSVPEQFVSLAGYYSTNDGGGGQLVQVADGSICFSNGEPTGRTETNLAIIDVFDATGIVPGMRRRRQSRTATTSLRWT
jgi:hypothetical protein